MSVPSSQFSNTASLNVSIPEVGEPPVLSDDEILASGRRESALFFGAAS